MRNLKKKLQQIDALQARQQDSQLDQQQQAKLAQRGEIVATLEALQLGCSLEEAQKAAKPMKHLSSVSSSDLLHRSTSNASLDSSSSKRKPRTGKHKQPTSQPSRLSMTASTQDTAQLDTHGPDHMSSATDTHHADPNSSSAFEPDPNQDGMSASTSTQGTATAEAVSPVPSAWQRPVNNTAAGFTISGFSTPQGQKTAAAAWPSPSGGSVVASDQGGHVPAASPSPSGAASRAKPPRKGGLSMFLSGIHHAHCYHYLWCCHLSSVLNALWFACIRCLSLLSWFFGWGIICLHRWLCHSQVQVCWASCVCSDLAVGTQNIQNWSRLSQAAIAEILGKANHICTQHTNAAPSCRWAAASSIHVLQIQYMSFLAKAKPWTQSHEAH